MVDVTLEDPGGRNIDRDNRRLGGSPPDARTGTGPRASQQVAEMR